MDDSQLSATHPVDIHVDPPLAERNRLTVGFRLILAIPHFILVGGPAAAIFGLGSDSGAGWGASGGVIGFAAAVCAVIAWFAIVFTGRHPDGLWDLAAYFLRWRVRAVSHVALFRDEYPPFGNGDYPAWLRLERPTEPRNRLTVGFRLILVIPHLIAVWLLGLAWAITSIIAWLALLFTGEYPDSLYQFGIGVFRWSTRVEAYTLLLRDEYPPFSLD